MARTKWLAAILAVAGVWGALAALSCAPSGDKTGAPAADDKLKRGEYLTTVSGCGDCHTPGTLYGAPDMSRQLAGSEVGWQGPWGVTFARNLTPDPETGLGNWSEADIVTAIRTGKKPDGTPVLPPMPWPDFSHYTDEDAYAVAAYLKSIPPVAHRGPATIPPGKSAAGYQVIVIPAPGPWDAPRSGTLSSGAPGDTTAAGDTSGTTP